MVDQRKLLKDLIRGMLWDRDEIALPGALDAHGKEAPLPPEESGLFCELVAEVLAEDAAHLGRVSQGWSDREQKLREQAARHARILSRCRNPA